MAAKAPAAEEKATITSGHKPLRTTGIGSLPHHNVDAALDFSFRMGIPFLPQIPIRNPWEYMIAQALEGLPGLQVERDGSAHLNLDVWSSRASAFQKRLEETFAQADRRMDAFEAFEPSSATSSSWSSFVWELEERGTRVAKIQMAGPLTAQWALRLTDGTSADRHPELLTQIYRLVLARALAMTRRLKSIGVRPLVYLDEPGLYGLTRENPRHLMGLEELRILVKTLSKEGAQVGLHCCSNTDWNAVLGLGIHILSIDAELSLDSLLGAASAPQLDAFIGAGGRLSLGVIPTARSSVLRTLDANAIFVKLLDSFARSSAQVLSEAAGLRHILANAIYTPACGLALHTIEDAEFVLELLNELDARVTERIGAGMGA